jgi:hypothetical protein
VKVKKATKRLSRVEALLSAVLDGYATDIAEVRGPLESATAAVKRARSAIDNQSSSTAQATATSGHTAPAQRRLTAQSAKKTAPPQKKQIASTKRKGNQPASQPKNRISAEGLKRIADANRRRANRRATPNTPATATQRKKSNSGTRPTAARKVAVGEVAAESPTSVSAGA